MNNRRRVIAQLYKEDYNRLMSGGKSYLHGIPDIYPTILPFKHLPRKKKKRFKKKWGLS